jgi:membrane associated rhomboid family serine protease
MTQPGSDPLAALLYAISQSEPQPWYPRTFAESRGVPRDSLDPPLERLRMLGLVELTEWVANLGQGYRLTPAGKRVLYNPRLLVQLAAGTLAPAQAAPEPAPQERWGERGAGAYERGEAIRAGLLSRSPPVVTVVLIALNIAVYLAGLSMALMNKIPLTQAALWGDPRVIDWSGAVSGRYIAAGQWWRLLAAFWVHIGLLHLAMNMYVLWVLGPISEKMWGRWRFLALYLISGFGANCVVALTNAPPTAGASGAIWGVMTAFLVWVYLNRTALPAQLSSSWMRSIGSCLLLNIFITFMVPHISIAGHLGGGGFGAVAAVLLNSQRFAGGVQRLGATLAVAALPVLAAAALVVLPKNMFGAPNLFELLDEDRELVNGSQERFRQDVGPVLGKAAVQRSREEVAAAQEVLKELRNELTVAIDALQHAGKSRQPKVEALRQAMLDILRQQNEYYRLAGVILEKGTDLTEEDSNAFANQRQAFEAAKEHWGELPGP